MSTLRFEAMQAANGWELRIPGVVDRLAIDGRSVWRDRSNAEVAAGLWLDGVKSHVQELSGFGRSRGEIIGGVSAFLSLSNAQTGALLDACNWFVDEPDEPAADEVEPVAAEYSGGADAQWVALTERWFGEVPHECERWIDPSRVIGLEHSEGVTIIRLQDADPVKVNAQITEIAAELGLVARDCRSLGAPAEEEE